MNSTENKNMTGLNCSLDYTFSEHLDELKWSFGWIGFAQYIYVAMMSIVSLSVILHVSCLITITAHDRFKSKYNLLVAGLSVADAISSGVLAPIRLYRALINGKISLIFCKVLLCINIWASYASLTMITCIAVFRAVRVTRPMRPEPSLVTIVSLVSFCFVLSAVHSIKFVAQEYNSIIAGMYGGPIMPCSESMDFKFYSAVIVFVACVMITIVSYVMIIVTNIRSRNRRRQMLAILNYNGREILSLKSGITIFVDIIISLSLFMILVTYPTLKEYKNLTFTDFIVQYFASGFPLIICTLHPIIYFYSSNQFRANYTYIWCCLRRRQNHPRPEPAARYN